MVGRTQVTGSAAMIVAFLLAAGAFAAEPGGPSDHWLELATPHFTFFSDAGARATRRVAGDLEELHATLTGYTTDDRSASQTTYVYVFRNHAAFAPYNLLYEGRPVPSSGYFTAAGDANYIAIDADSRLDASAIVYHEYLHDFVAHNLRGLPLWFEEGLSELYQSFRVAGRKVQLGLPDPVHLRRLNSSPLIPLSRLVRVDHRSALYNEPDGKAMFYAESWALVHYLVVGSDQRRVEAQRFIALLGAGVPQEEALAAAFSTDLDGLQEELELYVQRRIFRYVELPAPPRSQAAGNGRPMARLEVMYRLGDLLAHQEGREAKAVSHFRAVLAEDAHHAPAMAALGLVAERQARWDEAAAWYARAAAAAPADPAILYRLGTFLLARDMDPEDAVRALERSTELAPGFGSAWAELTHAYLATGADGDRALAAATTAHRLLPARDDVTRRLLQLYLSTGRRDDAVALVEQRATTHGLTRARGRTMIVNADLRQANELAARGDIERATALAAMAESTVAGAAGEADLRHRIASLREEILRRRLSRAYNAAVASYNHGDLDEALRILDQLEPLPEGEPGQEVRALRQLIEHPGAPPPAGVHFLSSVSAEQVDRLNLLLGRGDLDGAAAYLDELRPLAGPEQAPWIDAKRREIRHALVYNAAVGAYNVAVDQFNADAYGAAIATLETFLASNPPRDIAADARALLDEARAAIE